MPAAVFASSLLPLVQSVKFPFRLDVFDLCNDELKAQLNVNRQAAEAYSEYLIKTRHLRVGPAPKRAGRNEASTSAAPPPPAPMEVDGGAAGSSDAPAGGLLCLWVSVCLWACLCV